MMLLHARPRYRKGKVYAPPLCTVLLSSAARALCWTPFMDLGFIWLFYLVLLNQTWQNNLFVNLWTCTHSCPGSCTHMLLWFMDVGILHVKFNFEVGGWAHRSLLAMHFFISHPTHSQNSFPPYGIWGFEVILTQSSVIISWWNKCNSSMLLCRNIHHMLDQRFLPYLRRRKRDVSVVIHTFCIQHVLGKISQINYLTGLCLFAFRHVALRCAGVDQGSLPGSPLP